MSVTGRRFTESVTLFTWGYYGWGNYTKQLVEAFDAVEDSRRPRSFKPPIFVDIRIRRAGRAKGFQGAAFEKLDRLRDGRYKHMKGLGNRAILTGGDMQIDTPADAEKLLNVALSDISRRVVFFCGCEFPRRGGRTVCHRDAVANLVLEAASEKKAPVEIVEWPGGEPTTADLDVSPGIFKALVRGRTTVPLGDSVPLPLLCGLPWGSIVTIRSGSESMRVISGPAKCRCSKRRQTDEWSLPVFWYFFDPDTVLSDIEQKAAELREELGLYSRPTPKGKGKRGSRFVWFPGDVETEERSAETVSKTVKADDYTNKEWDKYLKEVAEYVAGHYDYAAESGEKESDEDTKEMKDILGDLGEDDLKTVAAFLRISHGDGPLPARDAILAHVNYAHQSQDERHVAARKFIDGAVEYIQRLVDHAKATGEKIALASIKEIVSDLKGRDESHSCTVAIRLGAHENPKNSVESARAIKVLMAKAHKPG